MSRHRLVAVLHQRADHRRGDAENGDAVAFDNRPEPVRRREVGHTSNSTSVAPMVRAPQIAHGPIIQPMSVNHRSTVVGTDVEAVHHVLRRLDGEAAVHVHRALGAAGGAAGVDDHERRVGAGVGDATGFRHG